MKVINNSNGKMLVEYVLKNKGELDVNNSANKKLDFVATNISNPSEQYGILVGYRNIPCIETRSYVFKTETLTLLKKACADENLIPTVAFLLFDEEKHTTYVFLFTVDKLEELSKDGDVETFKEAMHGFQIKYGIGYATKEEFLNSLKMKIDCTELRYSEKNFFD